MGKNKKQRGRGFFLGVLQLVILPIILGVLFGWFVGILTVIAFIIIKIISIKKRGYFFKDKNGTEINIKQFFTRWKDGIQGISPLQQAKTNVMGTWITMTGILAGMVVNALVRMTHQWIWIEVILTGSLILVVIQMIGGLQKYWRFKEVEETQKKIAAEQLKEFKKKVKRTQKELKKAKIKISATGKSQGMGSAAEKIGKNILKEIKDD